MNDKGRGPQLRAIFLREGAVAAGEARMESFLQVEANGLGRRHELPVAHTVTLAADSSVLLENEAMGMPPPRSLKVFLCINLELGAKSRSCCPFSAVTLIIIS